MKKILITGATGFIGRHVVPSLLNQNFEVHVVVNNRSFSSEGAYIHHKDLLNENDIGALINQVKPSHLLHLAWYATPGKFWNSEMNLNWVRSSLKLIQEFVNHGGQRLVVAGTCAEYDWNQGHCDELTTDLKPHSLYGSSKAALYHLLDAYAKEVHLNYAWGRVFFLYGPHEYKERLVPSIILKLLNKEDALCSHGNQIRDFMHVEDVAEAFVALINSQVQGAINIASGQNVSLKKVIAFISHQLDAIDKIKYGAIHATLDPPLITANVQKLFNEVNWSPKYTLEEGLIHTIEWWKKNIGKYH